MEKSISELIRLGEEKDSLKVNPLPNKAVSLNDLKPCPFCGGEATFRNTSVYYTFAVYVVCIRCHTQTAVIVYGDNGTLNPEDFTRNGEKEAKFKAQKLWNRRVNNEHTD